MKNFIIKHIRDKKHNYIGTFVAIPDTDDKNVNIGWSKCHRLDKEKNRLNKISSKRKGLDIAMARAKRGSRKPVPLTLIDEMLEFVERISKYYKDKNIIVPAGIQVHIKMNNMKSELKNAT